MSTQSTNLNFDELQWIIQIRHNLDDILEDDIDIPVSIFNVPKTLMSSDPGSYTPQQVALGPYHYWRPELYEMERYKLAAARRARKELQGSGLKLEDLVEQLTAHDPRIRAHYHKYLENTAETIAWMMVIDVCFMLEFLQMYAISEGKSLTRVSSRMSHLVDYAGRKSAHNAILRDMMMLENQVPLFVLREMLEFQFLSIKLADDMLLSMLAGLCKELSPFKMMDFPKMNISKRAHLLDFLYHSIIVPKLEEAEEMDELGDRIDGVEGIEQPSTNTSYVKQLFKEIWKLLSKLNKGPVRILKVVIKLPWKMLTKIPGVSALKQPLSYLLSIQDKEETKPENGSSGSGSKIDKPPLVEEITIPSVTELSKSGVRFVPTKGSISTISFNTKTLTLYLPIVSLDVNVEVILRNLVAYEVSNASGPMVFTRYTELMNGIIDTEEDVKLLRKKGILFNHLKSDKEAAELWNGMTKSIRLTKVSFLDKVIVDVNKYYECRWIVKAGKCIKLYVFGSWQILSLLATVFLLLLMVLQSFCSVYDCTRIFHVNVNVDE